MATSESTRVRTLGETNIGLSRDERGAVCALLDKVLADVSVLQVKTRKAHWDVSGPHFFALHKLWDEQYEAMAREIDEIAERVRMLGAFPVATMSGWLERSTLREEPGRIASPSETVVALVLDHEAVIRTMREYAEQCEEKHNDRGTADFFTRFLQAHESMAWMLRAFGEGEQVQTVRDVPRARVAGA